MLCHSVEKDAIPQTHSAILSTDVLSCRVWHLRAMPDLNSSAPPFCHQIINAVRTIDMRNIENKVGVAKIAAHSARHCFYTLPNYCSNPAAAHVYWYLQRVAIYIMYMYLAVLFVFCESVYIIILFNHRRILCTF